MSDNKKWIAYDDEIYRLLKLFVEMESEILLRKGGVK